MGFLASVALLTVAVSLFSALPGIYLVLSKRAMLVDAISHSLLPGAVLGFLWSGSLSSPILLITATVAALSVVFFTSLISATKLVPIGTVPALIFPPMLALGVLLITAYAKKIHLDTHTVLLGDLNLLAFDQLCNSNGNCFGPKHLYLSLVLLIINAAFIIRFRHRLDAMAFDPEYLKTKNIRPALLNATLMLLTALSVTAAFAAVGSILVIALTIVPAATARLFAKNSSSMLPLTLIFAFLGSSLGFIFSYNFKFPTSAGIAFIMGSLFMLAAAGRALVYESLSRQGFPRAQ